MPAEPGLRGSYWPSETQKELLRAALFDAPDAITSWRKVRSRTNLDALEVASQRLLPLAYVNLRRLEVEDSEIGRLKGLYKKTWFENELAFNRLKEVLTALHDADISTTVLKGAALTDGYYRDRGARPMHDMDVLVPVDQWSNAAEILTKLDWDWYASGPIFKGPPTFLCGWEFKHRDGYRIDLHWHVAEYFLRTELVMEDPNGWPRRRPAEIAGVATHTLDHPDQLIHVCLHGARSWPPGNVRWIADAMKLLHLVQDLDWDRVVRSARAYRSSRAMGEALFYLSSELKASIPRATVQELRATRISRREALGYSATSRANRGAPGLNRITKGMGRYIRLTAAWSVLDAARGLPRFMQEMQNLDRLGQIPMATLRRISRPYLPGNILDR